MYDVLRTVLTAQCQPRYMWQVCWKRMRDLRAVFEGLARGHVHNVCLRHLLLARCSLTAEVTVSQQTSPAAWLFHVLSSLQQTHFMNLRIYSAPSTSPLCGFAGAVDGVLACCDDATCRVTGPERQPCDGRFTRSAAKSCCAVSIVASAACVACSGYIKAMLTCLLHSRLLLIIVLSKFKAATKCQQVTTTHRMRISLTSCHACSAAARSACCACSTQARRPAPCLHAASCCTLQGGLYTAHRDKACFTSQLLRRVVLTIQRRVELDPCKFCRHERGDVAAPVRLRGFAGRQCAASGPEAGPCSRWRPHRRLRVGTSAANARGLHAAHLPRQPQH
jgi:hypothetical protein